MKKMNKNPGSGRRIFRFLITALAVVNLVLLFLFDYRVPGCSYLIQAVEANRTRSADETLKKVVEQSTEADESIEITFDSKKLTYNGKDKLDLTKGVTVTDSHGNSLGVENVTCKLENKKKKKKQKTIHYTYSDDSGRTAKAERTLELKDYAGEPAIVVDENDIPRLTDTSDDFIKSTYLPCVIADDGFGNDVSRSVDISLKENPDKGEGYYKLIFEVTNQVGDTATCEITKKLYSPDEEDEEMEEEEIDAIDEEEE